MLRAWAALAAGVVVVGCSQPPGRAAQSMPAAGASGAVTWVTVSSEPSDPSAPATDSVSMRPPGPPGSPGEPTGGSAPAAGSAAERPPATDSGSSSPQPQPILGPAGLAGVNDLQCRSAERPVVLLHGTVSTIAVDFRVLVPALRAAGRCVYGADYGRNGTGAVRESAVQAAAVIREVSTLHAGDVVDVVGFSQGGLVLRTALRNNGVSDLVATAVLISPSFHGTTSPLVSAVPAAICPACADQTAGSDLLTELDIGGDLDGDVRYAVAVTSADSVVTPWQSQIPGGPPERVRSVVVDQQCPGLVIRHEDMARDPVVVGWIMAALRNAGDVEASALPC